LGRTSFVDHENANSEDYSLVSDDDVDTIASELEENSAMSNSMIDGVNYHSENHSSTSSIVDDVSNGNMLEENIDVNVPIVDDNVQCVNKSKIEIVTREDRLLIRLSALCCDTNVPLYLANDIVEIFYQEVECGLVLDTSLINKHCAFLKQICERIPSPKAQSVQIGLEWIGRVYAEHHRNFHDSVNVVHYNFLEQVNDLLNKRTIFGEMITSLG